MKVAILGTGAIGKVIAREIINTATDVELLLADVNAESAAELAATFNAQCISSIGCNARDEDSLCRAFVGVDMVINSAHYEVNRTVMQSCLKIGAHYMDMGGLYHETKKQLLLGYEFQKAELTGVLGMGAAPGMTNVLASHMSTEFDSLEAIDACFAAGSNDSKNAEGYVFIPPYSIQTLLSEFGDSSYQFVDGELQKFAPKSGRKRVGFPHPIGAVDCYYTLHSEPATLPTHFSQKGIRRVTWRLALPEQIGNTLDSFISAGLDSDKPIEVNGCSVSPMAVLSACIERNARENAAPINAYKELGCLRVEATGIKSGRPFALSTDLTLELKGEKPNIAAEITGRPAAAAALMVVRGEARRSGVHGPEAVIPAGEMIAALSKRDFDFRQTTQ